MSVGECEWDTYNASPEWTQDIALGPFVRSWFGKNCKTYKRREDHESDDG